MSAALKANVCAQRFAQAVALIAHHDTALIIPVMYSNTGDWS